MLASMLFAALAGMLQPQAPDLHADLQATAETFIETMNQGDFDTAVKGFDATMTRVMPAPQLKKTWQTVTSQAGAYQKQLSARAEPIGKYIAVIVTCQFEKAKLDVRVVFD